MVIMTEKEAQDTILGISTRELLERGFLKMLEFYDLKHIDYWSIRLIGRSSLAFDERIEVFNLASDSKEL